MSGLKMFKTYDMMWQVLHNVLDEPVLSMKMFEAYDGAIKFVTDVYPHREKEVYEAIRDGKDSIYNCDVYKKWCYKKLLELNLHEVEATCGGEFQSHDFSKTNIVSAGYCFYDARFWSKLGIKNIWLYELDEEIRKINWRLTDYVKDDIKILGKTLDCVLDKDYLIKDVGLHINFNCEKYYHMKEAIKKEEYPSNCVFVFCGSSLKYNGPGTIGNGNINICDTLDDFIETLPNMNIFFKDTMKDKHMVIGCLE